MTEVLLAQGDGRLEVLRGRGSFTPDGAAWLLLDRDDIFTTTGVSALVAPNDTFELDDDVEWTAVIRPGAAVESPNDRPPTPWPSNSGAKARRRAPCART